MPQLPTLDVTQAQADRLLAAFGDAQTYRAWLRRALIEFVQRYEATQVEVDAAAYRQAKLDALGTVIPPEEPSP